VPDKRPAPFKVQWERALMRRSKLPLPCIAVLAALASYANADGGSIHPSQARLADDLGLTVRTVGRWIRFGLETGWILETRRGIGYGEISRPSMYILKIPDAIEGNQKQALPALPLTSTRRNVPVQLVNRCRPRKEVPVPSGTWPRR